MKSINNNKNDNHSSIKISTSDDDANMRVGIST